MAKITDVTQEYADKAKPGSGVLIYEAEYRKKTHENEIRAAEWLIETFGGDVTLLREHKIYGIKTPDFLWRGATWELKGFSSDKYGTIDKTIQKACKQICGNTSWKKSGGIILDFTGNRLPMERIKKYVCKSIEGRALGIMDVIIKKGAEYMLLRIKKE